MAMARRVSLFEREVAVRLAPVAVDLLHGAASALTEGELSVPHVDIESRARGHELHLSLNVEATRERRRQETR